MNIVPPLKRVTCIVQNENSASFENVKGFVYQEVSVDWNACADRHLLCPQCETAGASSWADLDKDLAMVAKMNELFAFGGAEHISLWPRSLSHGFTLRKRHKLAVIITPRRLRRVSPTRKCLINAAGEVL